MASGVDDHFVEKLTTFGGRTTARTISRSPSARSTFSWAGGGVYPAGAPRVAGTTPRPRTRYYVGFWANFGPIGRSLASDRLVDWWVSRDIPHDIERK